MHIQDKLILNRLLLINTQYELNPIVLCAHFHCNNKSVFIPQGKPKNLSSRYNVLSNGTVKCDIVSIFSLQLSVTIYCNVLDVWMFVDDLLTPSLEMVLMYM
ncbi:hypothetical protein ACF0H5_012859 [Mactra antiquata]